MMFEKPKIDGDIKITKFYGFTVYEYFEFSNIHGKRFVIEVCYNATPSETHQDKYNTRIRKSCVTDDTLEQMSTIEYKTPSINSDKEGVLEWA